MKMNLLKRIEKSHFIFILCHFQCSSSELSFALQIALSSQDLAEAIQELGSAPLDGLGAIRRRGC